MVVCSKKSVFIPPPIPFLLTQNPPSFLMGSSASACRPESMADLGSIDLAPYEDACRNDEEVNRFDQDLQSRTLDLLAALAGGLHDGSAISLASLGRLTTGLVDMDREVLHFILQWKQDIWNNPHLFALVQEFFDNSLATLDLCAALDRSVGACRGSQLLLQLALGLVPPSGELGPQECGRVTEELRRYLAAAANPFGEDFLTALSEVRERHMQMLEKLVEKKKVLDKKLKGVRVWKKVSTIMFGALVAVLLIFSVAAACILAPPIASALAAASSMPFQSMGTWVKSLWNGYERELKLQRELVQNMHLGTYVAINDLRTIKILVSKLEHVLGSMLVSIPSSDQERDPVAIMMKVEDISKKRDAFLKELDDFEQHVNQCRTHIVQARTIVLQRIIRRSDKRRRPKSF